MQAFNGNSSLSPSVLDLYDLWYTCNTKTLLKDGIFETGAYGVSSTGCLIVKWMILNGSEG